MAGDDKSKPTLKECNICGSDIEENADYCPECGADFSSDSTYNY